MQNLIIIGGGPSGYTAALYAARANLNPIVLTGPVLGGQLSLTSEIENFPGFPDGLGGMDLVEKMRAQAERFGAVVRNETATDVHFDPGMNRVTTDSMEYIARSVLICTGSESRRLNVPGEDEFFGRGVSTCATCDGAFYRGRKVLVVGGGDTAMEEGSFLTRFASRVYIAHRRDTFRASKIMQERVDSNEKIDILWSSVVDEIFGDKSGVTGARLSNVKTDVKSDIALDGLFIAIGHLPNTALFKGKLDIDGQGYLITDERQRTSQPGIFAAGDVQDHVFRQAITAAGTGCAAAMEAERYISQQVYAEG